MGSSRIVTIVAGERVNGHCMLFLMFINMMHCIFIRDVKNQHFQGSLLGGKGSHKKTLCTLLIMLTILDDP